MIPKVGDRVRTTGPLPLSEAAADQPDPSDPGVGATGTVEHVSGPGCHGYQISVRWDPPHERLRLMLVETDPFEVVQ